MTKQEWKIKNNKWNEKNNKWNEKNNNNKWYVKNGIVRRAQTLICLMIHWTAIIGFIIAFFPKVDDRSKSGPHAKDRYF